MRLRLEDLKVKSFVTAQDEATRALRGGAFEFEEGKPLPFTRIPCSAIDACPTAWICPTESFCEA